MALKIIAIRPKTALLRLSNYSNVQFRISTMKKYICILASAALLAACEQKTETTEPAATPTPTTPPATGVSSPATTDATTESPAAAAESPATTAESPAQSPPSQ
jgi:uncharacterized lipoprotein YajG